jgi:hypothetical protein
LASMQENQDLKEVLIPNTFWILPIIKIFRNTNGFAEFVQANNFVQDDALVSGYKLLIRQAMRDFFLHFERDSFLGLTEDFETNRVFFVGVDYDKFTSPSEKANMMRNIQKLRKAIRSSKELDSLRRSVDTLDGKLFLPLEKIFEDSFDVAAGVTCAKQHLLELVGASRLMNPVMRSLPKDEPMGLPFDFEMLGIEVEERIDPADEERLAKHRKKKDYQFPGYKIGLAFVLSHFLLDKKLIEDITSAANWESLAKSAKSAEDRIDAQLTKESGKDAAFGKFFALKKMPDKGLLGNLINKSEIPILSPNEKIDQLLLWYQFEVIDSARAKLFSGGSTLRSLILGELGERKANGVKDKLEAIRFVHHEGVPVFSYAILIERFGTLSDLSGWLIFMEVGGDYQGMGGSEYRSIEEVLWNNKDYINVRQFDVDSSMLRDYFTSKDPSETARLRSSLSDMDRKHADALGRLLEFLVKSYYDSQGYDARIYFDDPRILPRKKEVDILAIDKVNKRMVLAECSTNVEVSVEKLIDDINGKEVAIRNSPEFKGFPEIQRVFITPEASIIGLRKGHEITKRLNAAGIDVISVEMIISKLPRRFRRETLKLLFQPRKRKDEFDIDEDITKFFRRNDD